MPNPFFRFKQFTVYHDRCAMKVTTDACLFGAWTADAICKEKPAIDNARILDIGTGTGLLSLMIAQKNRCSIDAVEIDAAAAAQAAENVASSPWKESIHVMNADVLEWKPAVSYDVIFANPPFYENEIKSGQAEKNIAHHDGGLKLDALLQFIREHLKEDGTFFLLLPSKRRTAVAAMLNKLQLFPAKLVQVQQTVNHPPFRLLLQGGKKKIDNVDESTISVRGNSDVYTPEFSELLQPYYLYL